MALSEVMELEEEEDSIEASRFANTTIANDDESLVDAVAKKVSIVTPGDAPHDPMSTGNPAVVISGEASQGDSGSSSFINVSNPNDQPSGTSKDYATGETGSDLASLARKRKISRSESAKKAGMQHLMLHRTTTSWEDLEAEIDLWITRNRCIEATEGPEVALQDLQRNVFTRFSTRRDELEDEERRRMAANTAATKTQPASTFPYASPAMQKSPSLRRKLDHQRAHTVSGADSPGRARSLIGTIGLRSRARTNSARVDPQPDKGNGYSASGVNLADGHRGRPLGNPPTFVQARLDPFERVQRYVGQRLAPRRRKCQHECQYSPISGRQWYTSLDAAASAFSTHTVQAMAHLSGKLPPLGQARRMPRCYQRSGRSRRRDRSRHLGTIRPLPAGGCDITSCYSHGANLPVSTKGNSDFYRLCPCRHHDKQNSPRAGQMGDGGRLPGRRNPDKRLGLA